MISARAAGYVLCEECHKVHAIAATQCDRCGATLHSRKPGGTETTWALLIASMIAFIPANALPIMTVKYFEHGQPDTILSGIVLLLKLGMVPVALIVFIASFLVPLGKILGLFILLTGVHRGSKVQPKQRILLYRIVEFLGKWSMLDVFVVGLMAAIVNLGYISSIEAGPGITAFGIMVILTMFAAHSFDPRLIYDIEDLPQGDSQHADR